MEAAQKDAAELQLSTVNDTSVNEIGKSEYKKGHLGRSKMIALARSYVWWPGIDTDIEHMVKRCVPCQMQQKTAAKVLLHPWEWPTSSWERVHVDFVGPFLGRMFLVMVDAHSKWP